MLTFVMAAVVSFRDIFSDLLHGGSAPFSKGFCHASKMFPLCLSVEKLKRWGGKKKKKYHFSYFCIFKFVEHLFPQFLMEHRLKQHSPVNSSKQQHRSFFEHDCSLLHQSNTTALLCMTEEIHMHSDV